MLTDIEIRQMEAQIRAQKPWRLACGYSRLTQGQGQITRIVANGDVDDLVKIAIAMTQAFPNEHYMVIEPHGNLAFSSDIYRRTGKCA